MVKKEYAHLIKPLLVRKGPAGLYPEPRVWMEGKDMEGFNANFSFGFIKKTGVCHPVEGALIHPYDECLVFAGTDNSNILYLGAEISVELGEEAEEHVFNEPSVVLIPKGMPHGPVRGFVFWEGSWVVFWNNFVGRRGMIKAFGNSRKNRPGNPCFR